MRLDSSAVKSAISRKLGTCRSGMTSRCVSACGLMSRIATKPSVAAMWSPSRYNRQNKQSSGSEDPLLRDGGAANTYELTDRQRARDEPGRVVVPVAAPGAVDEDDVVAPDLRVPAGEARFVRRCPQACAPLLLHLRRHWIVLRGDRARARRVREDVDLRQPGL